MSNTNSKQKSMKPITINLQMVINMGNYESCRLGGEWSVEEGETVPEAMKKARLELLDSFNQIYEKRDGKMQPRKEVANSLKNQLQEQPK